MKRHSVHRIEAAPERQKTKAPTAPTTRLRVSKKQRHDQPVILSVDDEPNVLHTREAILIEHGYTVLNAPSSRDALSIFREHREIDVVLLDYALPEMDGLKVATQMKSERAQVLIIMVTGSDDELLRQHSDATDLVISKASGPDRLLLAIRQRLHRSQQSDPMISPK